MEQNKAEIHITGQKMHKNTSTEFQEAFPYLRLNFCSVADWKKAIGRCGTIYGLDTSKHLSKVIVKRDIARASVSS